MAVVAEQQQLGGLSGLAVDVVDALGPAGVALLVAVESVFPPIPSEVVLPLAGYLSSQGRMGLLVAIVAATVGSLVGAVVLYAAGQRLGPDRTRRLMCRLPLVDEDDFDRAEGWFRRHGRSAVLFGRMVPGVRSLVSLPAGVAGMPWPMFLLYTAVGSAVWNTLLIGLGYQLGSRWQSIGSYSDWINAGVYAVLAALVAVAVARRLLGRRRAQRAVTRGPKTNDQHE